MSPNPLHQLPVVLKLTDTAPDAELLRRFVEADDRTAFELVVRRHAELVWNVCRALLPHDTHAAEDAFQATFLVLARKASSVRGESAAGWLFRVARNAGVRARARSAKRKTVPLSDSFADAGTLAEEASALRDIAPVVAEEVDRLPANLREAVVLCFFEGHTHLEAATRLGWPVGTVASRLARAKDLLRERLTRRGVVFPVAGLVAAFASVPAVTAARVSTTLAIATGPVSDIPPAVLSLTNGVLSTMRFTKLKLGAALALVIVTGLSVAYAAMPTREQQPPNAPPVPAIQPLDVPRNVADEKPNQERLKPLQGKWRKVEVNTPDGDKGNPFRRVNELANTVVVVEKDKMVTKDIQGAIGIDANGKQSFIPLTEELRFPDKGDSQAVDLVITDGLGGFEGTMLPAIYKVEADRLTLCIRDLEHIKRGRPMEFKTDKTQAVIVLERVRSEKEELTSLSGEWSGKKLNWIPEGAEEQPGGNVVWVNEEIVVDPKAKPKWVLDGANVRFSGEGELGEKATMKLDPSATPPAIDLTVTRGEKTTKLVGIYWQRGNKLIACFAAKGDKRPKEIHPEADVLFYVLERKPQK